MIVTSVAVLTRGVAAVSGRDAWAVGETRNRPLIERWNGTAWKG